MKQKRQIAILFILLVGVAIVWALNFREKRVVTADASANLQDNPQVIDVENPHIRIENIERARSAEYKGTGRNPFSPTAAPAVVAQAAQAAKAEKKFPIYDQPQPPAPPPPPPPCILPANVKFYGYASVNGAARHAFFYDGDDVHIVGEGDVLLKRFRIIRIGNANLEFEEISRGCIGTAPLVEEPAGGPGSPAAPGGLPQ